VNMSAVPSVKRNTGTAKRFVRIDFGGGLRFMPNQTTENKAKDWQPSDHSLTNDVENLGNRRLTTTKIR